MAKIFKDKGILILIFLFFYLILEILTFNKIDVNGLPEYILLDVCLVIMFGSIIFLIKSNKISLVYLSILTFFNVVLFCANAILFNVQQRGFFTIDYLTMLDEAGEVFDMSYLDPVIISIGLGIFLVYLAINIVVIKFYLDKDKEKLGNAYIPKGMLSFVLVLLVFSVIFEINISQAKNTTIVGNTKINEDSYVKNLQNKAIKHYGMLTFYYREVLYSIDTYEGNNGKVVYANDDFSRSDYYGLLEGKNVITIMGETLQDYAICEDLTPNLYYLKKNGLDFSQNYSVNKTNMSEQIGITGSYYSFYDYEYDVDFAIPNVIDDSYTTTYIHDNEGSFYGRNNLMRYFGFDNMVFHDDLYPKGYTDEIYPYGLNFNVKDNSWHWTGDYTLDSVTIKRALPYMTSSNPFYTFWTTLSTHGPYDCPYMNNKDLFTRLGYFDKVHEALDKGTWVNPLAHGSSSEVAELEYYECAVIDLDNAIGILLDYLRENDLLDDTLLVIYGDHESFYDDIYLKIAQTSDSSQVDKLYQTTMIMYNPTLNERYLLDNGTKTITKFSSPYIVCTTVLDLLGADYDPKNYINYSFFDDNYIPVFYSTQQESFMNNIYYSVDCEKIKYMAYDDGNQEEFLHDCLKILDRITYVKKLYSNCVIDS